MPTQAIAAKVESELGLETMFVLGGVGCLLRTNSITMAETIGRCAELGEREAACELNVTVTEDAAAPGGLHLRGMHHLVVISGGSGNVFVVDIRRRVVTAQIGVALEHDLDFWRWSMLPILAGILGPAIGVLPAHSACLARGNDGMMIVGESGAGKSTLSAAMVQRGFDYISDDWTYCTVASGELVAWGMAARIKLLPDATRYFPVLSEWIPGISMNGECAFEVPAAEGFGARVRLRCRPRMLVFLRRGVVRDAQFERLDGTAIKAYFERSVELLPPELAEAEAERAAVIEAVMQLPCWSFECGGTPVEIAAALEEFYEDRIGAEIR